MFNKAIMYRQNGTSRRKIPNVAHTKHIVQWYYMEENKWIKFDDAINTRINELLNEGRHKGNIGSLHINFNEETVTNRDGKVSYIAHHLISKPVLLWYYLKDNRWIQFDSDTNRALNTMVEKGQWKGQIDQLYFNLIEDTVTNQYSKVFFITHQKKHTIDPTTTHTSTTESESNRYVLNKRTPIVNQSRLVLRLPEITTEWKKKYTHF